MNVTFLRREASNCVTLGTMSLVKLPSQILFLVGSDGFVILPGHAANSRREILNPHDPSDYADLAH